MNHKKLVVLVVLFSIISHYESRSITWNEIGILPWYPLSTVNDFWYFAWDALSSIALSFIPYMFFQDRWTKILPWLYIGKLIDEFTNPYGYHPGALLWDLTGLYFFICKWKTPNVTQNDQS